MSSGVLGKASLQHEHKNTSLHQHPDFVGLRVTRLVLQHEYVERFYDVGDLNVIFVEIISII